MSHYGRLKVTQDAPVEVIRAAYRVLAAKYHPDRQQVGDTGAADANAEMSALNTAYQVLIHPDSRRDYDALLAARKELRKSKVAPKAAAPGDVAIVEPAPNTRVDMEWLPPKGTAEQNAWRMSRRMMFLGGSLTGVLLVALTLWVWQMTVQHQMEQALSDQYAARPANVVPPEPALLPFPLKMLPTDIGSSSEAGASLPASPSSVASAPARMPSVTDLSKLTNEELAQLLPAMDGGSVGRRRREHHPLDGQPLNLRQDGQLIEVLPSDTLH